jgi:thiol:disulfide interchange protein
MLTVMLRSLALLVFCLAGLAPAQDAFAQFGSVPGKEVTVSLVGEGKTFQPGKPFTVALKLVHSGPWHTYWANPGIGKATGIRWTLPDGFEAGPIQWPVPKSKEDTIGTSNIFDGTIYLLTDITAPKGATIGESFTVKASANWLRCDVNCVPGKADFSLRLTAQDAPVKIDPEFDKVRKQQPQASDKFDIDIVDEDGVVTISVTPKPGANTDPGDVYIFHTDEKALDEPSAKAAFDGMSFVATFKKTKSAGKVTAVNGFAYASNGWLKDRSLPSLGLDAAPAAPAVPAAPLEGLNFPSKVTPEQEAAMKEIVSWGKSGAVEKNKGLLLILGFAFLGGLILNLMPCVFPVLGLKIMGFVSQSGEDKSHIKNHGLAFGAGVLLSMWVLVGALLIVRAVTGDDIVWGEQLRQPWFVAAMIAVIFAFGLSLAGVFEFGTSLMSAGGQLQNKKGLSGSFFSGLLTVLIASPCTGPFMAPAISFALDQSPATAIVTFSALGLGLASPYVILSFFPALVQKLPKPGAWMETFKQFMAFPMFATVVWLVSVFGKQVGVDGVFWLLMAMLVLAIGLWCYGRYATPVKKRSAQWFGRLAAVASLGISIFVVSTAIAKQDTVKVATNADGLINYHGILWEPLSPASIVEHRKKGRTVFVDFTADW